jgi:hypothetical protein
LNFIQIYIGYIGASRSYGLHFELMDAALFLTNEGITIYLGHKYRWSRKWRVNPPKTGAYVRTGAATSALSKPAQLVAAAAGGLATAAQALATAAVPVPAYAPVVSVVPLKRSNSKTGAKQPFASNAPQHDSTDTSAVQPRGRREKVRARAMAG